MTILNLEIDWMHGRLQSMGTFHSIALQQKPLSPAKSWIWKKKWNLSDQHTVSFHERAAIKWSTSINDETKQQTIIAAILSADEILRSSWINNIAAVNSPTPAWVTLSNIAFAIGEFEFRATSQSPQMQTMARSAVKTMRKIGNSRCIELAFFVYLFIISQLNNELNHSIAISVTANRSGLRCCYVDGSVHSRI